MKANRNFYLYGSALLVVAAYQAYQGDFVEMALYVLAALAFGVNGLTGEPAVAHYKRPLVVLSWVLIVATIIDFLYLMRFRP